MAIVFYDKTDEHWHRLLKFCRHPETGAVVRQTSARLKLTSADERVPNVDGASGTHEQWEDRPPGQLDLHRLGREESGHI